MAAPAVAPGPPKDLSATAGIGPSVALEWSTPDGADESDVTYEVRRAVITLNPVSEPPVGAVTVVSSDLAPGYTDTGVSYSTRYGYWIRAIRSGLTSTWATVALDIGAEPAPAAPTFTIGRVVSVTFSGLVYTRVFITFTWSGSGSQTIETYSYLIPSSNRNPNIQIDPDTFAGQGNNQITASVSRSSYGWNPFFLRGNRFIISARVREENGVWSSWVALGIAIASNGNASIWKSGDSRTTDYNVER